MFTRLLLLTIACAITLNTTKADSHPSKYVDDFKELVCVLSKNSATVRMKQIDLQKVGDELLPEVEKVSSDEEFGKLCIRLVAQLGDSHARLLPGSTEVPDVFPDWYPGFACLKDDKGLPVIYYVADNGAADNAGLEPGMIIVSVYGKPAPEVIAEFREELGERIGYSTEQYREYDVFRRFVRQHEADVELKLIVEDERGKQKTRRVKARDSIRYIPHLPVPIKDINDGGSDVQWTKLKGNVGYIFVRRIKNGMEKSFDKAVKELRNTKGIIIDVRANSGGGFNGKTAFYNFDLSSPEEKSRTVYKKPLAVLISPRCISAGEGWSSWFVANKRTTFFGEPTAGASGRKTTYTLPSGLFKVRYVVKPYKGYLDRPIEGRGLEPDVHVVQSAVDLADERDTVLEAAREYLLSL